jgi:hypothetical protein
MEKLNNIFIFLEYIDYVRPGKNPYFGEHDSLHPDVYAFAASGKQNSNISATVDSFKSSNDFSSGFILKSEKLAL